jgi:hypothetical protein
LRRAARVRSGALRCALLAIVLASLVTAANTPRFFPDDPLWVDDDAAFDASGAAPQEDSNGYDFIVNSFRSPGERRDVRALNVNTLNEVPDSSWFTNRIGRGEMTLAELVRGPDRHELPPSLAGWVVSGGKSAGVQPGFRMRDPSGHIYQIEVDPPDNPEMATGAETIGTGFYHAFGYHVVEVYLTEIDGTSLKIADDAMLRDALTGQRRKMTPRDLEAVFKRAARLPNGRYRVLVSRFADGKPLGNFRYYGTRPDDPNDIFPHEHRRELRGARVFAAWLNHDDSRGVNSLDMLETRDGRGYIKHYMFDFGSILGSATVFSQRHRAGNEYIFESAPGWKTLASLGLWVRPWMLIDYPELPPALGRIEGDAFEPAKWKPEYPNPAFDNMRPDDAFWAARIVSRFSDAAVRALVGRAQFSDPRATDMLTDILVKRRDKVLTTWLNGVNPVVDFVLDGSGELTWKNAAVDARVADPPASYTVQWFAYDNMVDQRRNVSEPQIAATTTTRMPQALARGSGEYVGVVVTAQHPRHAAWANAATMYFRRSDHGWTWVGAERE